MTTPSLRRLKTIMASLPSRVFTAGSWGALVREHPEWGRSSSALLTELQDAGVVTVAELRSESGYAPKRRYVLSRATTYEVAVSLQKRAFLCHASAASLHALTEQVPQTYYVNVEQTKKNRSSSGLSQNGIDRAFQGAQRMSKYVFIYGDHRIVQLSGKNSDRYGVIDVEVPGAGPLVPCASVERTLIDLLVRPSYGGGVHEVLVAFRLAKGRVSISELIACLRALDYVYPYHQSLGFYLDRAGYDEKHVARVRAMPRDFDFYLAYGMTDPVLDKTWRVYHPRTL